MFNTPRSRSVAGDAKTGPELLERRSRQSFCHDIGELLIGGHMENSDTTKCDVLPDEVNVELNMLRPSVMDRVGSEIHRGDVVTVNKRRLGNCA